MYLSDASPLDDDHRILRKSTMANIAASSTGEERGSEMDEGFLE